MMYISKDTFICFTRDSVYFRIKGYGLAFNIYSLPLFSERMGFNKPLFRFKKFTIRVLKPYKPRKVKA